MLVLSRKIGEEVVIHTDIRVRILAVNGSQVRLGISAPDGVSIWRAELIADDPLLVGRRPVKHAPERAWDWKSA